MAEKNSNTASAQEYIYDWNSYGQAVLSGAIPVSKWTKLGVERHYRDLKQGHKRGLYFSEAHAQHALETFLFLKHSKGAWAGQDFILSPHQVFWIAVAFGWLKENGTRRFLEVWEEVPRKDGKSTKLAGIGIHLMYFDGEGGAEVYNCATKLDQAKAIHDEAKRMVQTSPLLRKHLGVRGNEIYNLSVGTADKFVPLGRDSKTLDGLNPHGGIFDEVHAHPNGEIYNVVKSGTGARRQPLLWSITTAGFDLASFGYDQHLYAQKVLNGIFPEADVDNLLAIIYTVDDPNDWGNPLEWQKANPNWHVTTNQAKFKADYIAATQKPTEETNFKTKHLNIWLASGQAWIKHEDWKLRANKSLNIEDFKHDPCWIGLDLAEKSDIAATCLVFRRGKQYFIFFKFYLNEYQVHLQGQEHFAKWERKGELTVTEGNSTDFNVIADDLRAFKKRFKLQEIAYDPKFAAYFASELLEEGLPMVEITQTSSHFTLPIIEIQNMVLTGDLEHEGKESMDWMMSNVVMRESKFTGLLHPTKEKRELKIDGPVAMLMAVGRALGGEVDNTITQGFVAL